MDGIFRPSSLIIIALYYGHTLTVPTAPPTNIKVHPFNTTSAFLSWRPPLAKHRNGITREYIVELVKLNTTIMFQYTTQDPYLLINNLEPDKVYMSRIAAITVGRGPYSESVITTTHLLTDNDHISISENDHCGNTNNYVQ